MSVGISLNQPQPLFNLPGVKNAPKAPEGSGYTFDPVKAEYTRTIGSAADDVAQRERQQKHEDILSQQEQLLFPKLLGAADAPNTSSLSATGIAGGFGAGLDVPTPPSASFALQGIQGALKGSRDATYAAAKDRAANTASAAMNGLTEELQRRGMGGAGYEAGQVGNTLSREANQIGAVDRQGMEDELGYESHAADMAANTSLAERGQDAGIAEANANRTLAAREAAANTGLAQLSAMNQSRTAMLSMLTNALNGLNRAY